MCGSPRPRDPACVKLRLQGVDANDLLPSRADRTPGDSRNVTFMLLYTEPATPVNSGMIRAN